MRSVEIGGKEYRIEYDIDTGCDMEDKAGKSFGDIVNLVIHKQDLRSVRVMFWGGLRKNYPDLTLTDAADLISLHGNWPDLTNTCIEEMKTAGFFGKAEEKTPPKKRASARSTATS